MFRQTEFQIAFLIHNAADIFVTSAAHEAKPHNRGSAAVRPAVPLDADILHGVMHRRSHLCKAARGGQER